MTKRWAGRLAWLWIAGCLTGCGARQEIDSEKQAFIDQAVQAAEAWLQLVDEGRFEESWQQSAEIMRTAIRKEEWLRSLRSVRPMMGDVRQRTLDHAEYHTTLPGAPDGQYVVIRYQTEFANKKEAIETITPMREPDGIWRVSGYYIK